jgi:hypothetical protein
VAEREPNRRPAALLRFVCGEATGAVVSGAGGMCGSVGRLGGVEGGVIERVVGA